MSEHVREPLRTGDPVRVRSTKWDGSPHWAFDGRWLGADEHGDWVGFAPGTRFERPGSTFVADWSSVSLFPRAGWAAGFNLRHPRALAIYVDLATEPAWRPDASGATVSYVDLDLDVVGREGRRAYIDDEDEFAAHAVRFAYPPELVERVRADADALLGAVHRGEAPFDGPTAARWLALLERLGGPA
jgi:protein associated with RNAse G/E